MWEMRGKGVYLIPQNYIIRKAQNIVITCAMLIGSICVLLLVKGLHVQSSSIRIIKNLPNTKCCLYRQVFLLGLKRPYFI